MWAINQTIHRGDLIELVYICLWQTIPTTSLTSLPLLLTQLRDKGFKNGPWSANIKGKQTRMELLNFKKTKEQLLVLSDTRKVLYFPVLDNTIKDTLDFLKLSSSIYFGCLLYFSVDT